MSTGQIFKIDWAELSKRIEAAQLRDDMLTGQAHALLREKVVKDLVAEIEKVQAKEIVFEGLDEIPESKFSKHAYPIWGAVTELIDSVKKPERKIRGLVKDRNRLPPNLLARFQEIVGG